MNLPLDSQYGDNSTPTPLDPETIRKVWHNGEWYFSVVDAVAFTTDRTYDQARKYWKNLKSEIGKAGSLLVSQTYQLKLPAADGKRRLTDVANTETMLRILQEIPGPKTNQVKDWLAQVGAERLEEADDPELAFLRTLESAAQKFKAEGRSESWIAVRVEGIVARKQFVEALQAAVIDAIPAMYAQATEKVYVGLWDRTTAQLRGDLQIKRTDNPRDHFGEYALIYTRLAEKLASEKLGGAEIVTLAIAMDIVWMVAKHISVQAKATSELLGYNLITGKPLLPGQTPPDLLPP